MQVQPEQVADADARPSRPGRRRRAARTATAGRRSRAGAGQEPAEGRRP